MRGVGFSPEEALSIYFGSERAGAGRSSVDGTFKARFRVPADAVPGDHAIRVTRDGVVRARALFTVRTDWPRFHFDAANTGLNPFENVLNPQNVPDLELLWAANASGHVSSTPVVVDDLVYVGSGTADGTGRAFVMAAEKDSGTIRWKRVLYGLIASNVTVVNATMFVRTFANYRMYALDAQSGHEIWSFQASGGPSQPTVVGDRVFLGTNQNTLYALDASSGDIVWDVALGGGIWGAPAVEGGLVFMGARDERVYAVDGSSGEVTWRTRVGGPIASSPAVSEGTLYVGADDGNLYALDSTTGAIRWAFQTRGAVGSSPAVADGVVYVGSEDRTVYALDAATGGLLWRTATDDYIVGASPSVANGVVYIGSHDQRIYAMDAGTGEVLWSYETNGVIGRAPSIADGVLYVGSFDGNFYAFGLPEDQRLASGA